MDGHELYAVGGTRVALHVCEQGDFLKEIGQREVFGVAFFCAQVNELFHCAEKLFHILLARDGIGIGGAEDIVGDAAVDNDFVAKDGHVFRVETLRERGDEGYETLYLRRRGTGQCEAAGSGVGKDVPRRHGMVVGVLHDFRHCRSSDAACGIVDDAAQGLLVVVVGDEAEVGNDILDLLALIERQSADDAVWDAVFTQLVLEGPALCVVAVEDGDVVKREAVAAHKLTDVTADGGGLFAVGVQVFQCDRVAVVLLGEDGFVYLSAVVGDETVGGEDDVVCRTVVLLELEDLCRTAFHLSVCLCLLAEGLPESEDIIDIGASETVDGLCVVADDADVC